MSEKFTQREPGPVAIRKGLDSLIAGLNARNPGYRWRVVSPPDQLEGAGLVGAGEFDQARVVAPDHEDAICDNGATGTSSDEHHPDHAEKEIA